MTKAELIMALAKWPEDAQVEIAVAKNIHSEEPFMEDKYWLKILMVEETNPDPEDENLHCLIFGGDVKAS